MDNQQIITVIFSLGFLVIGAVLGIVGAYEPGPCHRHGLPFRRARCSGKLS